ncbi:hypothetical protein B4065_2209 [Caldibacillus thermoamylovorans]|nr:hypothetical protein B4065_2209 [Caldibacillus thermoamylovorans]
MARIIWVARVIWIVMALFMSTKIMLEMEHLKERKNYHFIGTKKLSKQMGRICHYEKNCFIV